MAIRISLVLSLALLVGCGGSGSSSSKTATAASTAGPVVAGPTGGGGTPPAGGGTTGLPTNAALTAIGSPTGGLPVISDLVEFDGKLWLLESIDPLRTFGAQVWTWDPAGGFTKVLDDPTSQGYLRGKVIGGKLYVPDADPNGLAPGTVYIFDSASGSPLATSVDNAVHNFDVVERNGQLYTSGGLDNGASGLNRYDPTTQRWSVVSQGSYSRLKYMAVLDGEIFATKRTLGTTTADFVRIDAGLTQQGASLIQGAEALTLCMEAIGGDVYMSLSSSGGISHVRVSPGPQVTPLTGISGAVLFDYVRHSDGNIYAVGSDLAGRSFIYGSTDGVAFSRLVDVGDLRFGQVGGNADGRPSLASFQGRLYAGSSTNGTLYRLD